ncbi:MAG TPA: sigma-54 dependent transcriptional regulator [Chryseosolibacter sp.]|nr:sigma-54 dependent transcriptional regulator [Chryseosolibacter sp.]
MVSGNVLIVDDDELVLLSIRLLLEPCFTSVQTLANPERIPAVLERQSIDVVLLDMNFRQGDTTGNQGRFWLKKIRDTNPETQVILLTAYGDIQVAVDSMKEGALDFVVKPWENEKLLATVKTANLVSHEKKKVNQLRSRQKSLTSSLQRNYQPLIGESNAIEGIRNTIAKVAPTEANILILGPNGTGKEVIAWEIHQRSQRADGVFMVVDVGSLTETLFESEMFGYRKGAFTDAREDRAGKFEAAAGGTLLLDEIGNLSLPLQAKLLTVLQNKTIVRLGSHDPVEIDTRIICATNSDLFSMVKQGKFREDLLYRINTVEITVPPLLERPGDVPLIVDHYLARLSARYHKGDITVSDNAMAYLQQYSWPGNVRELIHTLERAVIMCDRPQLQVTDFESLSRSPMGDFTLNNFNLQKLEAWAVRKALERHSGNVTQAAEELGLSRGALYRRMQQYGI